MKELKDKDLGITYFEVPNKKGYILTSDGVLLQEQVLKRITKEAYEFMKKQNAIYDYERSKVDGFLDIKDKVRFTPNEEEIKPTKPAIEPIVEEPKKIKQIKHTEEKPIVKKIKIVKNFKDVNLFRMFMPYCMLILSVCCSCLSVYFTGTYLQKLQSPIISYVISFCMLIYGLIGSQLTRDSYHNGHKVKGTVFLLTSICTIGFSMLTSLEVNYSKYMNNHMVEVKENTIDNANLIKYNLLLEEEKSNKEEIERFNKDIEFQKTQYMIMWDSEKKQNVVVEGRISNTAQNKIENDLKSISSLTNRNKEIKSQLMELAEKGVNIEVKQSKSDKTKSLTELIGAIFHISGNTVAMLILILPSIFIDVVNVLAISIYNDLKKEDEE